MTDRREPWLKSLAHAYGWSTTDIDRLDRLISARGFVWPHVRRILGEDRLASRSPEVVLPWLAALSLYHVEVLALFDHPFAAGIPTGRAEMSDAPHIQSLLDHGLMADAVRCWYQILGLEGFLGFSAGLSAAETITLRDSDGLDGLRTLVALSATHPPA